jgi:cell division protein FtsB
MARLKRTVGNENRVLRRYCGSIPARNLGTHMGRGMAMSKKHAEQVRQVDESYLQKLEALSAAATPGPWTEVCGSIQTKTGRLIADFCLPASTLSAVEEIQNAAFAAQSREAVPLLCQALRQAWSEIAKRAEIGKLSGEAIGELEQQTESLRGQNSLLSAENARLDAESDELDRTTQDLNQGFDNVCEENKALREAYAATRSALVSLLERVEAYANSGLIENFCTADGGLADDCEQARDALKGTNNE